MRTCCECGCDEHHACLDEEYGACWWVEWDLCSHCAMELECDHAGRAEARLIDEMNRGGELAQRLAPIEHPPRRRRG